MSEQSSNDAEEVNATEEDEMQDFSASREAEAEEVASAGDSAITDAMGEE